MNVKKITAFFNNHQHKNNEKSWAAFRSLVEHLLQVDNEKNANRFNKNLSHLSSVIFYDNDDVFKQFKINELSEKGKEKLVNDLIKHFKDQVGNYEGFKDVEGFKDEKHKKEEYTKQSKRAAVYKNKIKNILNKDTGSLTEDVKDEVLNILNRIESGKLKNYGLYEKVKKINENGKEEEVSQYRYFHNDNKQIPEEIKRNLVLFSMAKNVMELLQGKTKRYLRSGQGFALDTVFRIPLQNNVNFDEKFYQESTKAFYDKYLPQFKTKLVTVHQNEYFMSEEEIKYLLGTGKNQKEIDKIITENAKKTAHCQTILDLYNEEDQEYNFQKKKTQIINKYIEDNKLDYKKIPETGKLTHEQTKTLGVVFQKMFYDFINNRQKKLKLVKVEELDQEDLTQERQNYLERKKFYGNIPLKKLDFFTNRNTSIKDTIFSAQGKAFEEEIFFKKENEAILTNKLEQELQPAVETKLRKDILTKKKDYILKAAIEEYKNTEEYKDQVEELKLTEDEKESYKEVLKENIKLTEEEEKARKKELEENIKLTKEEEKARKKELEENIILTEEEITLKKQEKLAEITATSEEINKEISRLATLNAVKEINKLSPKEKQNKLNEEKIKLIQKEITITEEEKEKAKAKALEELKQKEKEKPETIKKVDDILSEEKRKDLEKYLTEKANYESYKKIITDTNNKNIDNGVKFSIIKTFFIKLDEIIGKIQETFEKVKDLYKENKEENNFIENIEENTDQFYEKITEQKGIKRPKI